MTATLIRISNRFLSLLAGLAAFAFTMLGFLLLGQMKEQIAASLFIGTFAVLVVRLAAERPTTGHTAAIAALVERLLAVRRGDLSSPAPAVLRDEMPALASAIEGLFEQVRSNLDNFQTMAMYDPVTSLPNRIHFRREAERILKALGEGERCALLFIDLDGFKEVNDRLGHAQGDQVLTMVANRLRVVVKAESEPGSLSQPLLARLAGDEFTILLPRVPDRAEAERIAGRALAALAEPFGLAGQVGQLGASIGVALCPDAGRELTPLMKAADTAMYHAKASGRAQVCVYEPALGRASEERATLQAQVRASVDEGALELVYEPRVCLRTGAIVGAEALVRWNRTSGEPLLLDRLPALAEEAGLTDQLAEWSLAAAVEALARWRIAGLPQRLSLRLPASQAARPELTERLLAALDSAGPGPWPLELELTGDYFGDAAVRTQIQRLRSAGVTLSLGGFGDGDAGFAAVTEIAVDRLRLDHALVAAVGRSERARTVVSGLVHLGHDLGCETVAAGLERQEQLDILRAAGCDAVQGFFGAEPMAEARFVAWVAAQDCAHSLARAS